MPKRLKYVFWGVLLALVGLECRMVAGVQLRPAAAERMATFSKNPLAQGATAMPLVRYSWPVPDHLGFGLICGGLVLVMASAAQPNK